MMKKIFEWMREQRINTIELRDGRMCVEVSEVREIINEAEAKWEAECCEWTFMEGVEDCRCGCNGYHVDYMVATKYNFCPYCGKPINISEVE